MIIGIDASRALRKQRTGTEHYTAEIIKHMVALNADHTFRLYAGEAPWGDMAKLKGDTIEWRVMPFARGWTLFRLSLEMLTNAPDILFVPAHTLPLIAPKKSLVVIHDIGYDHFPDLYRGRDRIYHHMALRLAKRAAHILTISEFTRQDLHEKYKFPLEKITTVHLGFDPANFHPIAKDETSPREVPYFFFIGRIEYRKNISRMLEAFAEFKRDTKLPHKFLLAGRPAHGYDTIMETYHSFEKKIQDDIEFLGYTSQEDANRYLRHCEIFMFPSLFEGFGLPVLEAFASGVPVITSTTSSLPEVAGDAAILVDPWNPVAISDAMVKLAKDKELRQTLIERGLKRHKAFGWDKAAKETLELIEKVVRKRK